MKKFTKLALVASVAISANAMAMQAMDDATLGATTGQDGINIGIGLSKIEIEKLYIHDNDGLGGAIADAGAISIKANGTGATATNGIVITANTDALLASHNLADLVIDSDAGDGVGDSAYINIAAAVSGLNIAIGEIGVTASNAAPVASATTIRRGGDDTNYNKVLSGLTIKTGTMDANIQVGAAPQGAMIKLATTMIGGLEISNLGILDNSTLGATVAMDESVNPATPINTTAAGEIHIGSIKVADAGGKDLTVNAAVSVYGTSTANDGYLQIITGSGATTPATDMYVSTVRLGSSTAASIGDIEVQGLQTYYMDSPTSMIQGAKITISGH
jgi:hypothetical protein